MPRVRRAALTAAALLCLAEPAAARPFTVDDLLRQESLGATALDPSGRWLVIERRDPYDTAARYDYDQDNATALSRLLVADLARPGPARPLLAPAEGAGQVIAAFSPSGARLAIYRLQAGAWRLGVVTLATGAVRWFGVTPERPLYGRALQWLSDRELLVIARPDGLAPWPLRLGRLSAEELPARWAASARGDGAHTVLGSGAYAGVRARQPGQLLRLDTVTGARTLLATGEYVDLEIAPGGRVVALGEAGADLQPRADGPVQGDWGLSTETDRLVLLDLRTGRARGACPGCDLLAHLLAWSPDGAALLVYARAPGTGWSAGRLLTIDAATGDARPVGAGLTPVLDLRPEVVRAGWMGAAPIILARPAADPAGRPDWYRLAPGGPINLTRTLTTAPRTLLALDPHGLTALVDGRAWRIDPTGHARPVAADPVEPARRPPPAADGRVPIAPTAGAWVLTGAAGAPRRLRYLDRRGLHPGLDLSPSVTQVEAASATAPAAVVRDADPTGRAVLRLLRPRAPPIVLTDVNAGLAAVAPPRLIAIPHAGPDGQALTSWLFLPPEPPARPPPLVVRAYSGDVSRTPPRDPPPVLGLASDLRTLVGHGYAVLVPSLPRPRARGEPMAGLAERIGAVVDTATRTPAAAGTFDPQRVALWGQSYGGYTVMAAIAQSGRFRAAVSISGPSDLTAKWASLPAPRRAVPEAGMTSNWSTGAVETAQGAMGVPPWADPARYARNSPLLAADRIATPLLLVHGDQDGLALAQSEAMFSALYRQGKDAMLVTYWGEGHYIASPGNVRDLYARAFAFLDAHLRP